MNRHPPLPSHACGAREAQEEDHRDRRSHARRRPDRRIFVVPVVMLMTPNKKAQRIAQKVEDMNSIRNMVNIMITDGAPAAPDGRLDVYKALLSNEDSTEEIVYLCRSARTGEGPTIEQIRAGDYSRFPFVRAKGELTMRESYGRPLLWDPRAARKRRARGGIRPWVRQSADGGRVSATHPGVRPQVSRSAQIALAAGALALVAMFLVSQLEVEPDAESSMTAAEQLDDQRRLKQLSMYVALRTEVPFTKGGQLDVYRIVLEAEPDERAVVDLCFSARAKSGPSIDEIKAG